VVASLALTRRAGFRSGDQTSEAGALALDEFGHRVQGEIEEGDHRLAFLTREGFVRPIAAEDGVGFSSDGVDFGWGEYLTQDQVAKGCEVLFLRCV